MGTRDTMGTNQLSPMFRAFLAIVMIILGPILCSEAVAQIVINEIMASNNTTYQDSQGDFDDWIELYNAGTTSIDVGGMYLTDDLSDPTKWQVPTNLTPVTTMPPGGYLLFWADGDLDYGYLHAGFKLSADGEEIGLFEADGTTLVDSIEYEAQFTDVSYGRFPDGSDDLRYMIEPTPNVANREAYEGIVATPQFNIKGSMLDGPVTIELSTDTPGATIYYTRDGSNPFSEARDTPSGFVYRGSMTISDTTTIKAMAWKVGWHPSDVRTERYTFVSSDVRNFQSPLPIVVVDTMGSGVGGSQTLTYAHFIDTDEDGWARMTGETDFNGWAGLNVRGQSSAGFPKKQYHFEVWDEENNDLAASILGLPADSDWILQGPYSDKLLMRNALAYQWSNSIGRYAPRTRFIEMFLNTGKGAVSMSSYVGVYVFMEKIKIAPDRVDINEIGPDDVGMPEISGGFLFKKDKTSGGDVSFSTNRGHSWIFDDPPGQDLSTEQRNWLRNYMNAFETALYGSNFTDPAQGYAAFIDPDSWIDHHIIVELTKNIDGFRISTFLYKDRNGRINMGPVWDYNLSLGNADYNQGWISTGWYYSILGESNYPYWRRLFDDPDFRLRYADRWFRYRRGAFSTERLLNNIEEYATLLEEPQERNFNRWRILGVDVWPNWFIADTHREEVEWVKGWLAQRLAWMDSEIGSEYVVSPPPTFSQQGGHVDQDDLLRISASGGMIYYTLDGSDPRELTSTGDTETTVLIPESATKRVWVPTGPVDDAWKGGQSFNDAGWMLGSGAPGGVGYEVSVGYEGFITLNTAIQMFGSQTSCFIRIPFTLDARTSEYDSGTLSIRYDDGFIAYLNGVEIARRNFDGVPSWNSSADTLHDDVVATSFEDIEISNFSNLLRAGENILAIHGLNESITSSDFLISAELKAVSFTDPDNGDASSVYPYTGPISITRSTEVKARALVGGMWSAINEAIFAVGPVAENLRISEIMYHPADFGGPKDAETEYIELVNIGSEAINLNFVAFTDGVEFTFDDYTLEPNQYALVVRNIDAFEAKYGPDLPIAGQYEGSLDNGGEHIELRDAAGQIIHSFTYDDDWYDVTDGSDYSLTIADPINTLPEAWGLDLAWRPSTDVGGSPGFSD